jgi:hypothetical protein
VDSVVIQEGVFTLPALGDGHGAAVGSGYVNSSGVSRFGLLSIVWLSNLDAHAFDAAAIGSGFAELPGKSIVEKLTITSCSITANEMQVEGVPL